MVQDLAAVRDVVSDRVLVSGSDRGLEAGSVRGRGVRSHATPRGRRLGRELVAARERLGVAIDVELLPARHEALGSEGHQQEIWPLESAAARAVGARSRHAQEAHVGAQVEDVVEAQSEAFRELHHGVDPAQEGFGTT